MQQRSRRDRCGRAGVIRLGLTNDQLMRRQSGRGGQYHGRLELDLAFGLSKPRELKAALEELIGRRRRQGESATRARGVGR